MATDVQITSKREHIRRSGPIRSFREPIATDPRGRYPSGVAPPASNLRVLAALRKAGSSRSLISATRSRFSRTRTCFRRSSWFNARKKARRLGAFAFALYHGNSFELKTSVSRLAARVSTSSGHGWAARLGRWNPRQRSSCSKRLSGLVHRFRSMQVWIRGRASRQVSTRLS